MRRLRVNVIVLTNLPNIFTYLFTSLESINAFFDGLLLFRSFSFAFSFNVLNFFLIKALLFSQNLPLQFFVLLFFFELLRFFSRFGFFHLLLDLFLVLETSLLLRWIDFGTRLRNVSSDSDSLLLLPSSLHCLLIFPLSWYLLLVHSRIRRCATKVLRHIFIVHPFIALIFLFLPALLILFDLHLLLKLAAILVLSVSLHLLLSKWIASARIAVVAEASVSWRFISLKIMWIELPRRT